MSKPASGATVTRLFDPEQTTHYAISEEADLELQTLFDAMETMHQLLIGAATETSEVEPSHIAPLFYTFAKHGQRIMREAPIHFPRQAERKSA